MKFNKKIIAAVIASAMLFSNVGYAETVESETISDIVTEENELTEDNGFAADTVENKEENISGTSEEAEISESQIIESSQDVEMPLQSEESAQIVEEAEIENTENENLLDVTDLVRADLNAQNSVTETQSNGYTGYVLDLSDYHGSAGVITSDFECGEDFYTINATSDKNVKIENSIINEANTDNDWIKYRLASFSTRLNLEGMGANNYRNIEFALNQSATIYVVAQASNIIPNETDPNNSASRHLLLSKNLSNNTGSNMVYRSWVNKADVYKMDYTNTSGNYETLYLASEHDDVYIYYVAVVPKRTDAGTSSSWNFSNWPTGWITDSYSSNGLIATGGYLVTDTYGDGTYNLVNHPVRVSATPATIGGIYYTKYLALKGKGTRRTRNVSLYLPAGATVYVTAKASLATRNLRIENMHGDTAMLSSNFTLTTTPQTFSVTNTQSYGQGIRIYTTDEGAGIYAVSVERRS